MLTIIIALVKMVISNNWNFTINFIIAFVVTTKLNKIHSKTINKLYYSNFIINLCSYFNKFIDFTYFTSVTLNKIVTTDYFTISSFPFNFTNMEFNS